MQSLIDRQISDGGIGGGLTLPKGIFDVHDTIKIASVRGFKFGGEAPWATELRWLGAANRPLFDVDRCQDVLFEDFSIVVGAGKKLLAAAWIQNGVGGTGPNAAPNLESAHVTWSNIRVRGDGRLKRGFHVKLFDVNDDVKNDHHTFERVTISGYTEAAFTLEGRNAKSLGFDRCHCLGFADDQQVGKYAVDTSTQPNHGGAFQWSKGTAIGHKQADFKIGDRNDTIKIDGVTSEKSARLLQMLDYGDGAEAQCPVLIENYRFGSGLPDLLAPDGEIIQCEAAGPLSVVASKLGSRVPGQQLRIRFAPNPLPGAFVFLGNAITNDGDGNVFPASPPTVPYQTANLGYRDGTLQPL